MDRQELIIATGEDEIQYYTKRTLSRGVSWLQRNHHIKNCNILRDVISHYNSSSWNGGIAFDKLNNHVQKMTKIVAQKIKEIDPNYNDFYIALGKLARDVLDHWDSLWDWDEAYAILSMTMSLEVPLGTIDPFFAFRALQGMENQFIIEAIGEKN